MGDIIEEDEPLPDMPKMGTFPPGLVSDGVRNEDHQSLFMSQFRRQALGDLLESSGDEEDDIHAPSVHTPQLNEIPTVRTRSKK